MLSLTTPLVMRIVLAAATTRAERCGGERRHLLQDLRLPEARRREADYL